MFDTSFLERRSFFKWLGAAPLLAYVSARSSVEKAWAATGWSSKENIYTRIGVRPFINARGTWTYLSGSLELPEVRQAKQQASNHFVDIFELEAAVSKRLAELSGAEAGMVTSGAAGAMAAATAACIAGTDPAKVWQLPDTTGLKHEVIMFGGRSAFDSAIRLAGGKLVLTKTHDEMKAAINDKTAMIYTTARGERLEKAVAVAKETKVPLMLDDAAGIPPVDNVKLYARMGVDLYCFSGGKGLCGPQCTGLLFGRKDLIDAAIANYSPWEGAVCRPLKVGKEEIMGALAALEAWSKRDLNALNKEWQAKVERVKKIVDTVPGVKAEINIPQGGNSYPTLNVTWDEEAWKFTVADCDRKLREGTPRIEVLTASNPSLVPAVIEGGDKAPKNQRRRDRISIISMTLQPGEDLLLGKRLRDILTEAKKAAG